MNHKIRLYEKGDEYQIVRLFKEVYNKDLTVEQWRWKYLGQGNLRVWSVVAFNEKDELIAHYGGIPVRMIFKGRHIIGCQCVDAMVKEGYRAKELGISQTEGVFYKLSNLLYDTFGTFFYAFPGDVYYNWGRKTGHIEECMEVPEYRIDCRKHQCPKETQRIMKIPLSLTLSRKGRGDIRIPPPLTGGGEGEGGRGHFRSNNIKDSPFLSLKPMHWTDRRIDELWGRVEGEIGWAVVRDREFIKWRYETNPFYKHKIYGLEYLFSRRLSGWVVLRENGDDLMIMDSVFEDGSLEPLLRKVAGLGCSMGKKQVRMWLPDRYKKGLLSEGFEPIDIRTWMPNFIRFKVAESEEIRQNLYYTMGDTDFL